MHMLGKECRWIPLSTQPPSTSREASQSISPAASKAGEKENTRWEGRPSSTATESCASHANTSYNALTHTHTTQTRSYGYKHRF